MPRLTPVVALLMVACGRDAERPPAPSHPPTPLAEQAAQQPAAPAAATARPLTITLKLEHAPRGVGLHVLNTGDAPVELDGRVVLENERGERAGSSPELCFDRGTPPGCVTLVPGGELIAPAWLGRSVPGEWRRDDTEPCGQLIVPPAPGRYRLRVRRCASADSASVDFVWPAP